MTRYEAHYKQGGFGYEAEREKWLTWVQKHYVDAFDLMPTRRRFRWRPRPSLLDIPSGDGFWTSIFSELGFDAQGIDLSPSGVEQGRLRYPHMTFQQGNAEEPLPVTENSFDVVFSRGITHLHHQDLFTPGAEKMAANLMKYVNEDGQLLVSYFTKRDSGGTERHHYHPVSDLVRLFEIAGDVRRVEVVKDFVQISVRHRPDTEEVDPEDPTVG